MASPDVVVEPVDPGRTLELRQRVLRPHQTVDEVARSMDDGVDLCTYAALDEATGEVLSTGNLRREEAPPGLHEAVGSGAQWRLRGMATREELRGQGIGALVLEAMVDHVADHGGGVLWCSARIGARRFYAAGGFEEWGEVYQTEHIGPHVYMWCRVQPAGGDR